MIQEAQLQNSSATSLEREKYSPLKRQYVGSQSVLELQSTKYEELEPISELNHQENQASPYKGMDYFTSINAIRTENERASTNNYISNTAVKRYRE